MALTIDQLLRRKLLETNLQRISNLQKKMENISSPKNKTDETTDKKNVSNSVEKEKLNYFQAQVGYFQPQK